jgi:hypothetical protein
LPYANSAVRLSAGRSLTDKIRPAIPCALPRPPHPAPTSVTFAKRPSKWGGMGRACRDDLPDRKSWNLPVGLFCRSREMANRADAGLIHPAGWRCPSIDPNKQTSSSPVAMIEKCQQQTRYSRAAIISKMPDAAGCGHRATTCQSRLRTVITLDPATRRVADFTSTSSQDLGLLSDQTCEPRYRTPG